MLTELQRRARYAKIQELFRVRARNLQRIVVELGGFHQAARMTGKSVASLQQLCLDDHPWHRTMGDTLARELERTLRMVPGALDIPGFQRTPQRKL